MSRRKANYLVCDRCNRSSPLAPTSNRAVQNARGLGWRIRRYPEDLDVCPDCRELEVRDR